MANSNSEELCKLIPHIFLPPRLPQASVERDQEHAAHLLLCQLLIDSAIAYQALTPANDTAVRSTHISMLQNMQAVLDTSLTSRRLNALLDEMVDGSILALHVRAQNASVIIRSENGSATFEIFEVSLQNKEIMTADDRLLCVYPTHAVIIPPHIFNNTSFRRNVSTFLSSMDSDELLDAVSTTTKAGSTVKEVRDTTDPRYITQLFVGILQGLHGAKPGVVHRIQKRIADDVLWHNTYKPWRRSPLWLIIRVVLQTSLPTVTYKSFMVLFMSRVLSSCLDTGEYPSDILQSMRVKIARRMVKLGSTTPQPVAHTVEKVLESAEKVLSARWSAIQATQSQLAPWDPTLVAHLHRDTRLSLRNSHAYLQSVLSRQTGALQSTIAALSHPPRLYSSEFSHFSEGALLKLVGNDSHLVALCDFEQSVFDFLEGWVQNAIEENSTLGKDCSILLSCLEQYLSATKTHYSLSNPLHQSIKFLTILTIWVGIDQLALADIPLMRKFCPEIPPSFLEPLLIRDEKSLHLVSTIQNYIQRRHSEATEPSSIFSDSETSASFPIQYYNTSRHLSDLRSSIETQAFKDREQTRTQLSQLNQQYHDFMDQAAALQHDISLQWVTRHGHEHAVYEEVHNKKCSRCKLERRASKLSIPIHEWPLPSTELSAIRTIFELACPSTFSIWREVTYLILSDIGLEEPDRDNRPPITLNSYGALAKFYSARPSRLVLGSMTKSFAQSHYKSQPIPTAEGAILVNNGLTFCLFDLTRIIWTSSRPFRTATLSHHCISAMPSESKYAHLQYALDGTLHSSNAVIADQAACPKELNIHEHIAFGSLRSGGRLQWMNILRELRAQTLSFDAPEVLLLLTQAIWQVGPTCSDASGARREWHVDLEDTNFCWAMLHEAHALVCSIGENWEKGILLRIMIGLVLRVLQVTENGRIQQESYRVLRLARTVSIALTEKLIGRLSSLRTTDMSEARTRVCEMAATACSTYDVPERHLVALLSTRLDFYSFMRSAILVQENMPATKSFSSSTVDVQLLFSCHWRLLYRTESRLREHPERNAGLDDVLASLWKAFVPGHAWCTIPAPNNRLLVCKIPESRGTRSHVAHLNILNGLLLINGKPIGCLPPEITSHSTYKRIFENRILEVIPARDAAMEYETCGAISGYTVSFALRQTAGPGPKELIIRARLSSDDHHSAFLELIPHEQLRNDFPLFLVDDHVHWMDLETGVIEFRPLATRWESDAQNWHLRSLTARDPILQRGSCATMLVDVNSGTFQAVHSCLCVLEHKQFIVVTTSQDQKLSIDLPRFNLTFFLNDKQQIESVNMPNMIVDSDQDAGTLFGLKSQLVLCAKDAPVESRFPRSRRILIPEGTAQLSEDPSSMAGHTHVIIEISQSTKNVPYFEYAIDHDLGRLTCNVSLTSHLYLCYLHALTSGVLPDPLLGRTGTEEALLELTGSRAFSFQRLGRRDMHLLGKIAGLSPRRVFYPSHLQAMQDVRWSPLPTLAQSEAFRFAVESILSFIHSLDALRLSASRAGDSPAPDRDSLANIGNHHLAMRSLRRSTSFYSPDICHLFPAQKHPELLHTSQRTNSVEDQTQALVQLVSESCYQMQLPTQLLAHSHWNANTVDMVESWQHIGSNDNIRLSYSPYWTTPPEFGRDWLTLYQRCLEFDDKSGDNRYEVIFSFCSLIYVSPLPRTREYVFVLLACALNQSLRLPSHAPPAGQGPYNLSDGYQPTRDHVLTLTQRRAFDATDSPAALLEIRGGESFQDYRNRRSRYHRHQSGSAVHSFTSRLLGAWPSYLSENTISTSVSFVREWIDVESAISLVEDYFQSLRMNIRFKNHIQSIQRVLGPPRCIHLPTVPSLPLKNPISPSQSVTRASISTITQLVNLRLPIGSHPTSTPSIPTIRLLNFASHSEPPASHRPHTSARRPHELQPLLEILRNQQSVLEWTFGTSLEDSSRGHLQNVSGNLGYDVPPPSMQLLEQYRNSCYSSLISTFEDILEALSPQSLHERLLHSVGLWPRVTHRSVLQLLSFAKRHTVPPSWLAAVRVFARTFLQYQRSQRLLELILHGRTEDVVRELKNDIANDHRDSDNRSLMDPDWLLIQIDCNFLARPLQREVAKEMIKPSSGRNTLFQLNMGEGKSSVIVPFASASLADGEKFVRVVVLKALSNQMFDLLVGRLCGLTNRRVYYVPFSRSVPASTEIVQNIQSVYEQCTRTGGVLVTQPEHILSFQLMGLDCLISQPSDHSLAGALWRCQQWVHSHSRDILDESDELLHSRYQLVYTVGVQQALEDSPNRWITTQQLLRVMQTCAADILEEFPDDIQYTRGSSGSFPFIRLLSSRANARLASSMTARIISGAIPNLNFSVFPSRIQTYMQEFIVSDPLSNSTRAVVEEACRHSGLWPGLLLLRGFLSRSSGIVFYVFKERRWRVDFGPDLSRTMLAVPYSAKDVPSARAEFGHPDVAVALTCLSYYYGGLTRAQVLQCFEILSKLDDPSLEYDLWVATGGDDVHESVRHRSGINTRDAELVDNVLVPSFRLNRAVIDFFLQQVVFPRHAKEFPYKLSTSGWDLASRKPNITTGFSGTKDNHFLLPTTIEQGEPSSLEQRSTDAMVLSHLLQPENSYCSYVHQLNGEDYLDLIVSQNPEVRVLLDVGAQMLEFRNEELVRRWLDRAPRGVTAAIFFTDTDELAVRTRDGTVELFRSSPYGERLEECIVYLDDAHTRGTDLKLPADTRAALTLGPKVTKDRMIQGAMRMRKLGRGHSVLITAPPEIDRAIRSACGLSDTDTVRVIDVVCWALLETCADIRRHVPHWVEQGLDYKTRQAARLSYEQSSDIAELRDGWQRPEAKTLEELYGRIDSRQEHTEIQNTALGEPELAARLSKMGITRVVSARLSEEQEREVDHEMEREQQMQRPPRLAAATHELHQDIKMLVRTGRFPNGSTQLKHLFHPLWRTNPIPERLFSTVDFMRTVRDLQPDAGLHDYLRPLSWVLSLTTKPFSSPHTLVAISPYEANELLPSIRSNKAGVCLHVYTPRPVQSMTPLSDLRFFSVPSLPPTAGWNIPIEMEVQLGLWAGQLFLDDYEMYTTLCRYLGLYMGCTKVQIEELQARDLIQADGFVKREGRGLVGMLSPFSQSPIVLLKRLFELRRKGLPFSTTHMGSILEARQLQVEDFSQP
ncbi:hypothetical protein K488DRAFT_56572 [Vararia minispora EC-137]|uniref:Uncharacterized protein n=1 Tax=Vararia minispora EC-137 TaxID=1314806 RepID=A0ACB8QDI2_9AGAM|nr:hypothetical protein K488DRAFT_56572 [Vararia minispora EC-137]